MFNEGYRGEKFAPLNGRYPGGLVRCTPLDQERPGLGGQVEGQAAVFGRDRAVVQRIADGLPPRGNVSIMCWVMRG
jgi:hypothetical protein